MKMLFKLGLSAIALLLIFGCATESTKLRLTPPDDMNKAFMRYKELPGEKVFVCAIDASGAWTYAYDYGRTTSEEAAKTAAERCDRMREKIGVHAKGRLFAINNDVVYFDLPDGE